MRVLPLLLLVACVTEPEVPTDAPLPQWPTYYREVWRDCGSTLRDHPAYPYAVLRFHRVPGESFWVEGREAIGAWRGRDIWIASVFWEWPVAVRHEMLHAQLGVPGHPEPLFAHCDSLAAVL